jgi:hypothetical protein
MHYHALGPTGWKVSDVSFGAWAIGSAWGAVSADDSLAPRSKLLGPPKTSAPLFRHRDSRRRRRVR